MLRAINSKIGCLGLWTARWVSECRGCGVRRGRPTRGSEHAEPSPSPAVRLHPAAEYDNASIFHPPDVTH